MRRVWIALFAALLLLLPAPPVWAGAVSGGLPASLPLPQLFDRALVASREGDFASALPLWDAVIERAPQDAAAWSNRGNVRLALGDA